MPPFDRRKLVPVLTHAAQRSVRQMSLDDLGNLGDLLGGVGVIVTLIYLALQVRHNTRALDENIVASKIQTRTTMSKAAVESIRSARTDDVLIEIFSKAAEGEKLSAAETIKLEIYIREILRLAEHDFFLYRNGLVDEDEFNGTRNFYITTFQDPISLNFWEQHKDQFPTTFRNELDDILRDSGESA